MKTPDFLSEHEFAVFCCDTGTDTQSFVVRGPCSTPLQAFQLAFAHYDFDTCHTVHHGSPKDGTSRDVTERVAQYIVDQGEWFGCPMMADLKSEHEANLQRDNDDWAQEQADRETDFIRSR